jgi:hypothetical protein
MMKRRELLVLALLLVLPAILAGVFVARAQTGGGYDLTWNVVGSGYMSSTGASYSLSGTAGQAGANLLSGGSYTLNGGFWTSGFGYGTYLPLIVKS